MIRAVCLKTEYLSNPSAIDIVFPRLFWKVQGGSPPDGIPDQRLCGRQGGV